MSRAMKLDSLRTGAERARARLFPPSKWAGLFPSAAYRRPRPRDRRRAYASLAGWDALAWRGQFSRATSRQGFKVMLAFGASRRVCHPTAVCAGQLTGNHTRPASREACRRAAVKPRSTFMSPYAPARLWRAVRGAGALPLLVVLGFGFGEELFQLALYALKGVVDGLHVAAQLVGDLLIALAVKVGAQNLLL